MFGMISRLGCSVSCRHLRHADVTERRYDVYKALFGRPLKLAIREPGRQRPIRDLEGFCRRNGIICS